MIDAEQPSAGVPAGARPAAPAWARTADGLALLTCAAALFVTLAGRSLLLRYGQIVLPTAGQLLFAAGALAAIRHAAFGRPHLGDTVAGWRARVAAHPHAAAALRAFVLTRPAVFLVAYFAVVTIGFPPRPVGFTLSPDPLGNLPARFDAGWYGGIARHGYQWDRQFDRQRNIAFFPAMPMLMRPVGSFLGANTPTLPPDKRLLRMLWAGVIVSLAAFAWALFYVSRLGGLLAGSGAAAHAPLLLAAYPFAIFYNVPYTESLFLLACAGAFYHFHRRQWTRAFAWGLVVGLSRPNGALVAIPLAVLAWQQWRREDDPAAGGRWAVRRIGPRLIAAAAPGVGMLAFTAYLYSLTGVWLAWARMHGAWGRTWGTGPLAQGWTWLTTEGLLRVAEGVPYDTLNTAAVLFALGMCPPVWRRLGPAYVAFVLVNLVPPIFAGGALSMGRVTSTLFPLFIALAASLRPASVAGWAAMFGILQGLVATLFFTWRELF